MKELMYPMILLLLGGGIIFLSDSCTTSSSSSPSSLNSSIAGHEYVDLGLSVNWATCNVGADNPEDYGKYFAWGEIRPRSAYIQDNSDAYNHDEDIAGNSTLDAATANWGYRWRLPTASEIEELQHVCVWKWKKLNGKKGYKVTSTVNGKSIFLPAAGRRDTTSLFAAGYHGYYWSSTPVTSSTDSAYFLVFSSDTGWLHASWRGLGRSVRPVFSEDSSSIKIKGVH